MNLSPIAKAINSLCHELTPSPGAEPPTPRGGSAQWISLEEARAQFDPVRDLKGYVDSFCGLPAPKDGRERQPVFIGWDLGCGPPLAGWWAKVGGNPPVHLPHTVSLEDARKAWEGLCTVDRIPEQTGRVWFDEQDTIDPIKFEQLEILCGPFFPPR